MMKKILIVLLLILIPQLSFSQENSILVEGSNEVDSLLMYKADSLLYKVDSLSIYYESIGYYHQALDELNRLPDMTLSQIRRKANLYYKLDELDTTEEILLNEVLPKDTIFADLNLLATLYTQKVDLGNAIYYREILANKYPYNAANIILLSNLYGAIDLLEMATPYIERYIDKYPSNISMRRQRALNNFKLDDIESAHRDFSFLYDSGDENPNSLYYYGNILMRVDSIAKSEIVLEKGAKVTDYSNPIMLLDYAYVLNKQKKYSEASTILNVVDSLLNFTPEYQFNNFTLNELKGNLYLALRRYADAAKSFEKALKYNPNSEVTLYSLVMIENQLDRKERLRKWTDRYLQVVSRIPEENKNPQLLFREKKVRRKQEHIAEEDFMSR